MDIRREIIDHSPASDRDVLLWLLDRYHMRSEWGFVATCSFERYGKLSYQCHRVWRPTLEGIAIYNALS